MKRLNCHLFEGIFWNTREGSLVPVQNQKEPDAGASGSLHVRQRSFSFTPQLLSASTSSPSSPHSPPQHPASVSPSSLWTFPAPASPSFLCPGTAFPFWSRTGRGFCI